MISDRIAAVIDAAQGGRCLDDLSRLIWCGFARQRARAIHRDHHWGAHASMESGSEGRDSFQNGIITVIALLQVA